ncbi:hypothetical protein [Streptomyces mirabilis]|uniref:hypothetical protein n=1 Tax=Streptomyces mirabilis TaxID=68239 RepID=UPI002E37D82B|nr:hypothetical protein [Streptomyces mirabilis]
MLLGTLIAASAVFGVIVGTRLSWLGGRKQDFENAVSRTNPGPVLPTQGESLRRSFDWGFLSLLVVPTLVAALVWEPWFAFWPLALLPDRLSAGIYGLYWERRHNVLLWRGNLRLSPWGRVSSSIRPYDSRSAGSGCRLSAGLVQGGQLLARLA